MSKITTQDCKEFLKKELNLESTINLKRLRKYKDNDGCYIREFSTESNSIYLIKELSDGTLVLNNEQNSIIEKKHTEFNAKKLLKEVIKKLENYDEDVMEKLFNKVDKMNSDDKMKIANEFYFFFPDGVYENESKYVTEGLKTKMLRYEENIPKSFCIYFYDSFNSDPDLYLSDIVSKLIPSYFEKVDEYNFELDPYDNRTPKNITIEDVINMFENFGFKYKNDPEYGEEQCFLKKLRLK